MKINNRVKIVRSSDISGYTEDYIGMTGTIEEVKEIYPDVKIRLQKSIIDPTTSKSHVVKIDDKFYKKNFCLRADFFTEELEIINTPDDSEPIVIQKNDYKNKNLIKGGAIFVVFDYIDQSVSYKGDLYSIVNDYILPLADDNEWDDEYIEEVLNLKNQDEVRNFLYTNMDSYLQ